MAQKVRIIMTDDLDGGAADETVSFAIDGRTYEIDLSEQNANKLRDALAPFIASARRVGGRRLVTADDKPDLHAMRAITGGEYTRG